MSSWKELSRYFVPKKMLGPNIWCGVGRLTEVHLYLYLQYHITETIPETGFTYQFDPVEKGRFSQIRKVCKLVPVRTI